MLTLEDTLVSLDGCRDIPSVENLTSILQKCRKERNLAYANHVHAHLCGKGLEAHVALGNQLVPMFVDCGSSANAQQVFNRLVYLNEYSWTSLIEGYIDGGNTQHAFGLYEVMQDHLIHPSRYTFMALLKACTKMKCLEKGKEVHMEIIKQEYESDHFIGSSLMGMYAKHGLLVEAQDVFEELPVQDVVSWTALISGYADNEMAAEALECFESMHNRGVAPDRVTYVSTLKACGMLKSLETGRLIHAEVRKQGLTRDISIGCALIDMYVKCGVLVLAEDVCVESPSRDVNLWNALMVGYSEQTLSEEVLNLYHRMQKQGVSPDANTFVFILKACASLGAIDMGQELHRKIDSLGLVTDLFVGSSLVDMYSKLGLLEKAQETFQSLPVKETVSWTALIAGYTEHGHHEQALECLKQMLRDGMEPDSITFMCCLKSCASLGAVDVGQRIHATIIEEGYDKDGRLGSSLVNMYVKCGFIAEGQDVFDELQVQDLVSYTALITGYAELGLGEAAVASFWKMKEKGLCPDAVTFISCLKACSCTGSMVEVLVLHSEVVKEGFDIDPFVANSLMDTYIKFDCLLEAKDVFQEIPAQDAVSWTVLINGYTNKGLAEEAFLCYTEMLSRGISPNGHTRACILRSCGSRADIRQGRQIHDEILREGLEGHPSVGTSLVHMYTKCGLLIEAEETFSESPVQDVSLWNTMIMAYVEEGLCEKALACCKKMKGSIEDLDASAYVSYLKACGAMEALEDGQALHFEIVIRGFEQDQFICCMLIDMYAKCDLLVDAERVFDKLISRDVVSWNSIISRYVESFRTEEALTCLGRMQGEGILPNDSSYASILSVCGYVGDTHKGQELHQDIMFMGFDNSQHATCALLGMYVKCGLLADAQYTFDKLTSQDLASWNTLIAGYAEHGLFEEVFNRLLQMQVPANVITYVGALKACKSIGSLDTGQKLHSIVAEEGLENDNHVGSTLVDMYASCGAIDDANDAFKEMVCPDIFSWTALIAGYAEHGLAEKAWDCYEEMQSDGIYPDMVTTVCILQACGNMGALDKVQELHSELVKKGHEHDASVGNHVVQIYVKCNALIEARDLFDGLPCPDVVSWTALISGYADEGLAEEVHNILEKMQLEQVSPDIVTFICSLRVLGSTGDIDRGRELHENLTSMGFDGDPSIGNTLVSMYAKWNSVEEAQDVFSRLAVRDVVSWTALIGASNANGSMDEAFHYFEQMQLEGVSPDVVSWNAVMSGYVEQEESDKALLLFRQMQEQGLLPAISIFMMMMKACGHTAALHPGRKFHAQIQRSELETVEETLATASIDMYGKCGDMFEAQQVFDALPCGDSATWNALLAGYTRQGSSQVVVHLLTTMMMVEGIQPDDTTLSSVLTACTREGLVDMSRKFFQCMKEAYGIDPSIKHFNCLVDLLGRAGQMDEALWISSKMPFEPDFVVWSTLLGACQRSGDVERGRQAFRHAMSVDENHPAMFMLMSNMYADAVDEGSEGE